MSTSIVIWFNSILVCPILSKIAKNITVFFDFTVNHDNLYENEGVIYH